MLPLLNNMLYSHNNKMRRGAVEQLIRLVELLRPDDRGDYILKFILSLAHEEDDAQARSAALNILHHLAPHLNSEIVEVFIVPEIKSLSIDEVDDIRRNVASNLMNVCDQVSKEVFVRDISHLEEVV